MVYDSVKTALAAIAKLHGQKLPQQSQKPAKRHKADKQDATAPTLWARQVSGEGLHLKKWRLIIRNLAFKVLADSLPVCQHVCVNSCFDTHVIYVSWNSNMQAYGELNQSCAAA